MKPNYTLRQNLFGIFYAKFKGLPVRVLACKVNKLTAHSFWKILWKTLGIFQRCAMVSYFLSLTHRMLQGQCRSQSQENSAELGSYKSSHFSYSHERCEPCMTSVLTNCVERNLFKKKKMNVIWATILNTEKTHDKESDTRGVGQGQAHLLIWKVRCKQCCFLKVICLGLDHAPQPPNPVMLSASRKRSSLGLKNSSNQMALDICSIF